MKRKIKLGILDQSIVKKGGTAMQAVKETIETAKLADRLGYERFWVSEHHNSEMIAGSAPEVLMVKLADETSTIRVGSGGIMLPNHSALKVAENFRLLETLFPGRIDLGIGRAPGGDRISAALLNPANDFREETYLRQLEHLQAFFRDEAGTQFGKILAVPQAPGIPQQWILGSSGGSGAIAAKYGLGFVIARFINGQAGPEQATQYRKQFQASSQFPEPAVMVAINVICAATKEKAAEMRKLSDYTLVKFEQGQFGPMRSYEDIRDYVFSDAEQASIANNRGRIVSGTPEHVKQQLEEIADAFGAAELILTTMTYSQADRLQSFQLLADAFELTERVLQSAPAPASA